MDVSQRIARNEAIFREVNERIVGIGDEPGNGTLLDLVCECSNTACSERLSLAAEEYEEVRGNSRRFIVVPGHLWHPEHEREVARRSEYAVLEKFDEAGEVAEETDPRNGAE